MYHSLCLKEDYLHSISVSDKFHSTELGLDSQNLKAGQILFLQRMESCLAKEHIVKQINKGWTEPTEAREPRNTYFVLVLINRVKGIILRTQF